MKKYITIISIIMMLIGAMAQIACADEIPTAKVSAELMGEDIPVAGEKFTVAIMVSEISSGLFASGEAGFYYPVDVVTPVRYNRAEPTIVSNPKQMIGGVYDRYSSDEGTGKFSSISYFDSDIGYGVVAIYIDLSAEEQTAEVLTSGTIKMYELAFMLNEGYTYDDFYLSISEAGGFLTVDKKVVSKSSNGDITIESIGDGENIENNSNIGQPWLIERVLNENSTNEVTVAENNITFQINLLYNDEYYEAELRKNEEFTASLLIENTGDENKNLTCYIAEYNDEGSMIELTAIYEAVALANATITENVSVEFLNANTVSAKVFLWEKDTFTPLGNSVELCLESMDYYADNILEAQTYENSKKFNGRINTTSDIDYIRFVPTASGRYIIQTTGIGATGTLYGNSCEIISCSTAEGDNCYIKADLIANSAYYIKISGIENLIGNYSLTIEQCDSLNVNIYNNNLSIEGNVSSTVGVSKPVQIKLLSSSGVVLNIQNINTSNTGEVTANIPVNIEDGVYKIILFQSGKIEAVTDLRISKQTVIVGIQIGEFFSIPYIITNTPTLENICFALDFNEEDFEIYDVCEYTKNIENGTGLISGGYVNVQERNNNRCVFKSTRTGNWSGMVNSIKLKSKTNGIKVTTRYIYQVK